MKLLFLLALLSLAPAAHAQMTIIANVKTPVDTLSGKELRNIYSLTTREWEDGSAISPVILKGNESCMTTFYRVIDRRPLDMRKLWMLAKLSGEVNAPIASGSDEEVVSFVSRTPGAIGIIHTGYPIGNTKVLLTVPQ